MHIFVYIQTHKRMYLGRHMGTQGMEKCVSTFFVLPAPLKGFTFLLKSQGRSDWWQNTKPFTVEYGENLLVLLHILLKLPLWKDFTLQGLFAQCSVVLLVKFILEIMKNRIFPRLWKKKKEKVSRQNLWPEQVCACFPIVVNRVMNVIQIEF